MAGFYNRVGVSESAQGSRPVAFSTGVKSAVRRTQPASLPPVELHREPVQAELAPDKVK
jgi:hypothetical protein